MGRNAVLWTLTPLLMLGAAIPAGAVTINGVDYALFAETTIKMKDGAFTVIDGNVGVNDVRGLLRIGALNTITGTAAADKIFFGTGSKVGACEFNTSSGGSPAVSCGSEAPALVPITSWPPLPVPAIPSCVNTQPDVVVPAGGSANLALGCYGAVRIKVNATLTLSPGTYNFKSLRLDTGSVLNGNGAAVNLKGRITTGPNVTINDVTLTTVAGPALAEVIAIGSSSHVNNVLLYAPNGKVHLHLGFISISYEIVAKQIRLEPHATIP